MSQSPPPARRSTPPPFDPELAPHLPELQAFMAPDALRPNTIENVRAALAEWPAPSLIDLEREGRFEVTEVGVLSGTTTIPLVVCRPTGRDGEELPAVYFVHGGGMVMGSNRLGLDQALDWAEELGLVVVSVEYRLAPEFPYPAAIEDCYAGLAWVAESGSAIGVDRDRIILAGESGGGGLAASLAILARDRGGPMVLGQVLMAPMLDNRNDTLSSHHMAGLGIWDRISNETGWRALLGDAQGGPDVSPYAAAARAEDLGQLPVTFLDVGSAETFRDEVVTFASGIWAAGGDAELHVWPGGFHAFYLDLPEAQLSVAALRSRVDWLRRLLSRDRRATTDRSD
ncbi:alpha/beta hydrolase [Nocardioides sp. AN3]